MTIYIKLNFENIKYSIDFSRKRDLNIIKNFNNRLELEKILK